jgi:hypothetical protein
MIARAILIAAGVLITSAVAEAQDFRVVPNGRIDNRMGFGRRPARRVWVPGHYETRLVSHWVPGHYRIERVPAEYQVFVDRYGRTHRIVVRPACTRKVWVAGRYETRRTRVWVPGHYERPRPPTLFGTRHARVRHRR